MVFASLYALVRVETTSTTTLGRLDRLAIHDHHRRTGFSSGTTTDLLVKSGEHPMSVNVLYQTSTRATAGSDGHSGRVFGLISSQ